jgi:uncharacterized protein (TIGR00156 family)
MKKYLVFILTVSFTFVLVFFTGSLSAKETGLKASTQAMAPTTNSGFIGSGTEVATGASQDLRIQKDNAATQQRTIVNTQGGFTGPGIEATTVAQSLKLRDDSPVVLQGNIVRSIGKEKYTFKDATGEIVVDIDDRVWAGQSISPDDRIEIQGEIDKDFMDGIEVDVQKVTVLK